MNRNEEYLNLISELENAAPDLSTSIKKAKNKKLRHRLIYGPLGSLAAVFAVFVLLVNFCTPVAYACSKVPVLKDLAEAVSFSPSLTEAIDNDYVQSVNLEQTKNDIEVKVEYLIVDQKQVNVFFRIQSDKYKKLETDPEVLSTDGESEHCSYCFGDYNVENGDLCRITIDYHEENVPGSLILKLKAYSNDFSDKELVPYDTDETFEEDLNYLAEFSFTLNFDPEFTAAGQIIPVNKTTNLDGQNIVIESLEIYPTHLRVNISEDENNTAWLKDLNFYIKTDWGMKFDSISEGITATGSLDSPSMVSYRANSNYFHKSDKIEVVILGATWLKKDMETVKLNLKTKEISAMPDGVSLNFARKNGDDWKLSFKGEYAAKSNNTSVMFQLFDSQYKDPEGQIYDIDQISKLFGDPDEKGEATYFREEFLLTDYTYDEVWLYPSYSYDWKSETEIIIPVK